MKLFLALMILTLSPVYAQRQVGLEDFKRLVQENADTFLSYIPGQSVLKTLTQNDAATYSEVTILKVEENQFYIFETSTQNRLHLAPKITLSDIQVPEGTEDFIITHLGGSKFKFTMSRRTPETGLVEIFASYDLSLPQIANPTEIISGNTVLTNTLLPAKDPRSFDLRNISLCQNTGKCSDPADYTYLIFEK